MTRQGDTTAGRTSRPATLLAVFQALLGSGPPEGARDRVDRVRTILGARDDDAALGLVAVYESYLELADRWMRFAAVRTIAIVAAAQVLILGFVGWGMVVILEHSLNRSEDNMKAIAAQAMRQTCEDVYGEELISMARYFYMNDDQRKIAIASWNIASDDASRLAQMPDLHDRLSTIARLGPEQWRSLFNHGMGDQNAVAGAQKGMRTK